MLLICECRFVVSAEMVVKGGLDASTSSSYNCEQRFQLDFSVTRILTNFQTGGTEFDISMEYQSKLFPDSGCGERIFLRVDIDAVEPLFNSQRLG